MDDVGIERPDLRCDEHGAVMELLHSLHGRLMVLESRVVLLEERLDATDGRVAEQ
jgi:hypothetical protein